MKFLLGVLTGFVGTVAAALAVEKITEKKDGATTGTGTDDFISNNDSQPEESDELLALKAKEIEVFEDTKNQCSKNKSLIKAINESCKKQSVILSEDNLELSSDKRFSEPAKILVSQKRTFEAASAYKDGKTCVLNFASSLNPGGDVIKGSFTQESCLCRCSTLYPCLSDEKVMEKFYYPHCLAFQKGKLNCKYNDDCIYTPDVVVFKSDIVIPELLAEEEWFKVDVLSCSAMDFKSQHCSGLSFHEFLKILKQRLRRIFGIAKFNEVDNLILGAFGCGEFGISSFAIAVPFCEIAEEYKYDFKTIEFALCCESESDVKYTAFRSALQQIENKNQYDNFGTPTDLK